MFPAGDGDFASCCLSRHLKHTLSRFNSVSSWGCHLEYYRSFPITSCLCLHWTFGIICSKNQLCNLTIFKQIKGCHERLNWIFSIRLFSFRHHHHHHRRHHMESGRHSISRSLWMNLVSTPYIKCYFSVIISHQNVFSYCWEPHLVPNGFCLYHVCRVAAETCGSKVVSRDARRRPTVCFLKSCAVQKGVASCFKISDCLHVHAAPFFDLQYICINETTNHDCFRWYRPFKLVWKKQRLKWQ